jgi:LmbE family N-acetylglucosaminyl deacetylase
MAGFTEGWDKPQKILVMLAHPDDPEFFCGATIARWISMGHQVDYVLFTRGDKGSSDPTTQPEALAQLREQEQKSAADVLGVSSVTFLNHEDGFLVADMDTRKEVVRVIRTIKPDILVTCDPTSYFVNDVYVNHPDHRAAGQAVLEGYFPAAGSPMFHRDMREQGLEPHSVKEIWLSVTISPNTVVDVTEFWPIKIEALHHHRSQIGDPEKFNERMRTRRTIDSTDEAPRFEERFRRIVYR